jgi:hypothetical protein
MVAEGARLPVADATELAELGSSPADVRATGTTLPAVARPRDGALLRERSAAPVFLYAGGAPFQIPDPSWLERFGGWDAVRVVPDVTPSTLDQSPRDGTLLREWSDSRIFLIESGQRRWIRRGSELAAHGGLPSVRALPDGALASVPEGPWLPPKQPPATVPDVREMRRAKAGAAVQAAGFVPAFTGSTAADAWVASQTPRGDTTAEGGSVVTMQLRTGPIP